MSKKSDLEEEKKVSNHNREKYFRENRLQSSKELFKKIEYILFGYAISLFSYARFHEESFSIVKTHPKAFAITACLIILSLGLLIFFDAYMYWASNSMLEKEKKNSLSEDEYARRAKSSEQIFWGVIIFAFITTFAFLNLSSLYFFKKPLIDFCSCFSHEKIASSSEKKEASSTNTPHSHGINILKKAD